MYLVGAAHPNKNRAVSALKELVRKDERFVTDVEVYQEILHRYTAIKRPEAIDAAFRSLDQIVDEVVSFDITEIHAARRLLRNVDGISARDALHVAVMQKIRVTRILSFDLGLDNFPGIVRLA